MRFASGTRGASREGIEILIDVEVEKLRGDPRTEPSAVDRKGNTLIGDRLLHRKRKITKSTLCDRGGRGYQSLGTPTIPINK